MSLIITSCFEDLSMLGFLNLGSNALAFDTPSALWSLKGLLVLNLFSNFLPGILPPEVGNMKSIMVLDLSKKLCSGYIPRTIGELQNLATLSLSHNRQESPINLLTCSDWNPWINPRTTYPESFPSHYSLHALIYLRYLNVSFNKLQGEVSNGALCRAPHFQVSMP